VENRYLDLLERERAALGAAGRGPAGRQRLVARQPALRREALDTMIDETLLLQAARREGVSIGADRLARMVEQRRAELGLSEADLALRQAVHRQLLLEEMLFRHTRPVEPDLPAIRAYHVEHADDFQAPPAVRLRALTIFKQHDPDAAARRFAAAQELVARNGFAAAAQVYSEDIFAARGGSFSVGDDGYVRVSELAPAAQQALAGARPGAVVGPVDLGSALALLRVEARDAGGTLPLDEVHDEIRAILLRRSRLEQFDRYLARLRDAARITVH
jgi:parvulin-like peptidyl-prolyl isomerase